MAGHFEGCFGFAVSTGEQNVHHARSGATSKESFYRGRHNLGFGLARLIRSDQSPKTVQNDVHGVTNFGKLFFALDRARHIELEIKGDEFERTIAQLAVIANCHDEVHSIYANAFPATFTATLANPLAGDIWPYLIFDPRLRLIADPASLARED